MTTQRRGGSPDHSRSRPPEFARLSDAALSLWAKSGDDQAREDGGEPWLALPQHMLDSAGVAGLLWDTWASGSVRMHIGRGTGLTEQENRTLVSWLACVHDIGKATLSFAAQLEARAGFEEFVNRIRRAGLPPRMSAAERRIPRFHHSLASGLIVERWLSAEGMGRRAAPGLIAVLDAHHGAPSAGDIRAKARDIIEGYAPAWREVHEELLDFAADLTGVREVLPRLRGRIDASTQSLLTGLIIMADWIASNADAFPLTESGIAGERAEDGYWSIDLTDPWQPEPPKASDGEALNAHLRDRFGWPDEYGARPVQSAAAEACAALSGAGLVVIEAPTGEGKTEAALTAAEILAARSGAGGAMVAAPTMATADGLFRRVLAWSQRAGASGVTSMFLGHSKSFLNSDYQALKRHRGIDIDAGESGGEGAVVASQWLSGRKKGVLANFTVATVDQVLFMALQSKHSMLRHLGLAGKIVVIDEVHAYDAYMSEYLATALAWLARYRVPVVLLSATLPSAQKRALVEAYRREFSAEELPTLSTAYPLVTTVSADGVHEKEVARRPADLHARLEIVDDSLDALLETLERETADGGCVLVICNTVHRAQEAYSQANARFEDETELHHAAFLASQRAEKEELLRARLGPDAHRGEGRPHRSIIVATQVAEQSLDIDVDLLVTDLAPMDLLIQRIGRLHRHHDRPHEDRPANLQMPRVLIRGVVSSDPPEFESGTESVYDPKLLLATLAVLQEGPLEAGFTRPDDIAPLVHRVYGDDPPIPDAWGPQWAEAATKSAAAQESARTRANTYRLPPPGGAGSLDDLFRAQQENIDSLPGEIRGLAQVRDSDPTVEVIPILRTENGYRPLAGSSAEELYDHSVPEPRLAFSLAAATVRLPSRFSRYAKVFEEVLDQLEPSTPVGWSQAPLLKGQVALPLDQDRSIELAGRRLVYDDELGLFDDTVETQPQSGVRPSAYSERTATLQGEI